MDTVQVCVYIYIYIYVCICICWMRTYSVWWWSVHYWKSWNHVFSNCGYCAGVCVYMYVYIYCADVCVYIYVYIYWMRTYVVWWWAVPSWRSRNHAFSICGYCADACCIYIFMCVCIYIYIYIYIEWEPTRFDDGWYLVENREIWGGYAL